MWLGDRRNVPVDIHDRLQAAVGDASLIPFTTTASDPYVADKKLLAHAPTVLICRCATFA